MRIEKLYDFRKRIVDSFADVQIKYENTTESFYLGKEITVNPVHDEVIFTAIEDLRNFFAKIGAELTEKRENFQISTLIDPKLFGDQKGNGFVLEINRETITIIGNNSRGIAQGIYYIERLIADNNGLKIGVYKRQASFSPRMIHSGYGLDEYPDEYLSVIAHNGFDAVLLFTTRKNRVPMFDLNFSDFVGKAKKYGIDVYIYSYINIFVSPFDDNAKKIYDEKFGDLFKDCPDIKGIVMIGESNQYPSIDKNASPYNLFEEIPKGQFPSDKPSSGWWPCCDYPQWISLIRDSVRKYSPKADVVLWTYNWGYTPSKFRKELIENLPTDISLLVTWDMNERLQLDSVVETIADYGLEIAGPSRAFIDEAEIAKKRGINLYAMTNTCGRTWDFGVVPYEPMMYQWEQRAKNLIEAKEKYGLSGLMESHHYGFFPSFISELNNKLFLDGENAVEVVDTISRRIAKNDKEIFKNAMKIISEAVTYYVTTDEDQYGPCRIGTAYPLCLNKPLYPPQEEGVMFGSNIYRPIYGAIDRGVSSPFSLRIRPEIKNFSKMALLMQKGIDILKQIKDRTVELDRIQNICEYIYHSIITVINVKQFYIQKLKLKSAKTRRQLSDAINKIEKIAGEEIQNARDSIKNLEFDSCLGFEPSMGYQADSSRVLWKIEQVEYMLKNELTIYKESLNITVDTDGSKYFRM